MMKGKGLFSTESRKCISWQNVGLRCRNAFHCAAAKPANVDADTLYDTACVCAIASAVKDDAKLQNQYAARAVELLRQAVGKGYKDIDHLQKDEDLKALREREDYRKLLKELEEMKP